ncbi:hypothetical protein AAH446_17730 [Erwinia sp. P6884]|uniref:hypothetical protein n=1 Tax=Erwinia sp. P6884 TaxID=3141450 RepID=UPI003193573A
MKMKCGWLFFLIVFSQPASALFIKNLNIDLQPEKKVQYEEIVNLTSGRRVYTVSMVQVSIPRRSGMETVINDGALLYSPQKLVLNSGEKGGFKFFYKGKIDKKERYFRVKFIEMPIEADIIHPEKRSLLYDYRVAVEAIMIVRPGEEEFRYSYTKNEIKNTGNTYFKYMSSRGCSNSYAHSAFIGPGESLKLEDEQAESNRVIIYHKKIISLSSCGKSW